MICDGITLKGDEPCIVYLQKLGTPVFDTNYYDLIQSGFGFDPQSININTIENFPDSNFRKFIEGYMGVQSGGSFSKTDASAMTKQMDCGNKNIKSLKGIEYFTNLADLDFPDNPITDVDLSKNTALTRLECRRCSLSNLDTSNLVNLEHLVCCANNLSKIDISANKKLNSLDCGWNQITDIDVSNQPLFRRIRGRVHKNTCD